MNQPRLLLIAMAFAAVPTAALAQAPRLDPIPEGPESVVKALSPFRSPPDAREVAGIINELSAETGFPGTDHEFVLIARLWRLAGEPEQALTRLEAVDLDGPAGDLARYEAARLFLGDGDREGAGPYWRACRTDDPETRAEIWWDLLPVTTPEEREAWEELSPGEETCDWLREFWDERARRAAIDRADRLILHFERLAAAREVFWIPRPRFEKTTAEYHGRPEGLALDDRGLIYVRMGEPSVQEEFNEDGAGQPEGAVTIVETEVRGDSAFGLRGRCWPYWRIGGYRIYCFTTKANRSDNDWILTDHVPGSPGTQFFHRYVANSNLPRSAVRSRVRSPGFVGLRDPWEVQVQRMERRPGNRSAQLQTRENIDEALEQVADIPQVLPSIRMRTEALRFLNPETGQWHVWLIAGGAADDLTRSDPPEGIIALGGRFAVDGPDGVEIHDLGRVSIEADRVGEHAGLTLKSTFAADPGPVEYTVVLEDLNREGHGNWLQDTIQIPSPRGLPQLSDIAVAQSRGGSWTRDGRTYLQITPAHVTGPDRKVFVYFEVYGVKPGARYDVEFRLAEEDAADRIWRLDADDLAYRLQFTSSMTGSIGRHPIELDFGDTEAGLYTLAVRIQDENGAYSLPSVTDLLVAGE